MTGLAPSGKTAAERRAEEYDADTAQYERRPVYVNHLECMALLMLFGSRKRLSEPERAAKERLETLLPELLGGLR